MRIALTQSAGRLEGLASTLRERGFEVIRHPLIEIRFRLDAEARRRGLALARLPWLLFASRSAVQAWRRLQLPWGGARLGAVGPATAAEIERHGGRVAVVGRPATAAGLAETFLHAVADAVRPVGPIGLPRGDLADPGLERRLEAAGMTTEPLVVYETVSLPWRADADVDAVVLASPSAARALPAPVAEGAILVTLGPSTSRALRRRGLQPLQVADASAEAVVERLATLRGAR